MFGASCRRIDEYDAIGFDMDLCLARYRLLPVIALSYECGLIKLVKEKGYPSDLFPEDEEAEELYSFSARCLVDLGNLIVLKIGAQGQVLRAYSGYTRLSNEEIKALYGDQATIKAQDLQQFKFGPGFYFANDLFKVDYILVFIRIKELLNSRPKGTYPKLEQLTGAEILSDLNESMLENYHHFKEKYNPPEEFGYYYPMFRANPKRYLYKTPVALFERLAKLKEAGKYLFITTNAHLGYFDITFPFSTQDYAQAEELFDLVIMNAGKPKFFQVENRPFFKVDLSKKDLKSPLPVDLSQNKRLFEGNCYDLTAEIKRKTGKEEVKVLFFGDTPMNDLVCQAHQDWDCGFICEEFSELEEELRGGKDYWDFTKKWGSMTTDTDVNGNQVDTLIFHLSNTKYSKAFSRLSSPSCLSFLNLNGE